MENQSRMQKRLRKNNWIFGLIVLPIIPIIIIFCITAYIESENLQNWIYIFTGIAILLYYVGGLYYVQYRSLAIKPKERLLFLKIKNMDLEYKFPQDFISNLSKGKLKGENVTQLRLLNKSMDELDEEELQIALVNVKMFNDNLKYFSSVIFALLGIVAGLLSLVSLNYIVNNLLVVIGLGCFVISVIGVHVPFYIKQKNLFIVIQNLIEYNIEKKKREFEY